MAIQRRRAVPQNHERWLVSYADFITLLFAFFVVMFASSQTDKSKAKQISDAVRSALERGTSIGAPPTVARILGGTVDDKGIGNAQMRGPGGTHRIVKEVAPEKKDAAAVKVVELLPAMERLSKELEEEIRAGDIEVNLQPRGLVVSLKQAIFFPSGGDEVAPATYVILSKLAEVIRNLPNQIQLEGHTDSKPIHNARFRNNWELSSARAIAMLELLNEKFDLPMSRFAVVGRADNSPVDRNETEEGRRRNRRVDVVIVNLLSGEPDKQDVARTKPSPLAHE